MAILLNLVKNAMHCRLHSAQRSLVSNVGSAASSETFLPQNLVV